jgi:hypothetical protein
LLAGAVAQRHDRGVILEILGDLFGFERLVFFV